MNKISILVAFAFVCALSFAQGGYEECGSTEQNCMQQCCQSAGGTFTFTADYGECGGESLDTAAAETAYMDCSASVCRPALINCVAPSANCAGGYTSCFNSCRAGGLDTESCDASCFEPATTCVATAPAAARHSFSHSASWGPLHAGKTNFFLFP
jgi:hypothetical protein